MKKKNYNSNKKRKKKSSSSKPKKSKIRKIDFKSPKKIIKYKKDNIIFSKKSNEEIISLNENISKDNKKDKEQTKKESKFIINENQKNIIKILIKDLLKKNHLTKLMF